MNDYVTQAAAICGLILSLASIITLIVSVVKKAKAPSTLMNERIETLERIVQDHTELLQNDFARFEQMKSGNRIMQRCMLALLSHGIDGNDIDQMKQARNDLNEYLINH